MHTGMGVEEKFMQSLSWSVLDYQIPLIFDLHFYALIFYSLVLHSCRPGSRKIHALGLLLCLEVGVGRSGKLFCLGRANKQPGGGVCMEGPRPRRKIWDVSLKSIYCFIHLIFSVLYIYLLVLVSCHLSFFFQSTKDRRNQILNNQNSPLSTGIGNI